MSAYCSPDIELDQRLDTTAMGHTHPAAYFINEFLLENTHTPLCVYVLPMAAFMLQWQEFNSCNKLQRPKIFTIQPFTEKNLLTPGSGCGIRWPRIKSCPLFLLLR